MTTRGFRKWKVSALAAYCDLGDDWRLEVLVSNVRTGLLPSAPGYAPDLALLRADRLNKEGIGVGRLRRPGRSLAAASARQELSDRRHEVRSWVRSGSALTCENRAPSSRHMMHLCTCEPRAPVNPMHP